MTAAFVGGRGAFLLLGGAHVAALVRPAAREGSTSLRDREASGHPRGRVSVGWACSASGVHGLAAARRSPRGAPPQAAARGRRQARARSAEGRLSRRERRASRPARPERGGSRTDTTRPALGARLDRERAAVRLARRRARSTGPSPAPRRRRPRRGARTARPGAAASGSTRGPLFSTTSSACRRRRASARARSRRGGCSARRSRSGSRRAARAAPRRPRP